MSSESCQFSYFAFSKLIEAFSSNPNDLKTGLISALLDATTFRARHFKTSTQSNSGFSITESAYTSGLNNGFSILIAFHMDALRKNASRNSSVCMELIIPLCRKRKYLSQAF